MVYQEVQNNSITNLSVEGEYTTIIAVRIILPASW